MSEKQEWWAKGVRFQCQGSGNCCVSRGEYGFVFLTLSDRKRMAKHLKISTPQFTKKYCEKTQGYWHLKEISTRLACVFLENKKCGIYEARPTQCRTWPFWPEVMDAKVWSKEVATFCPGVGKGPIVSPQKIAEQILEQAKSEKEL